MTRLEKLRKLLRERKFDAVIIYDELNLRYLTEIAFTDGFCFITQDNAYLVTDFRYYEVAEKCTPEDFQVLMPDDRTKFLHSVIAENCVKVLGFEGATLSFARYKRLSDEFKEIRLADIGELFDELRRIKDAAEIEKMQKAQDITDKAFSHILKMLTPGGMTETDVAAELEYFMRKNGAEGVSFDTIAVCADASSMPHGVPRNEKLKRGFLTMDFGAKFDGYCSDMTRTVVIGRADREMKKLYNTVLQAQTAALEFLREGADAGEADKIARDIIDKDYNGTFGHSLGHSIGLYIHEAPSLSRRAFGYKLRRGEILTVEPGIYIPGKYGCRIEDMVKIEEKGIYNFTKSPKDLIEI